MTDGQLMALIVDAEADTAPRKIGDPNVSLPKGTDLQRIKMMLPAYMRDSASPWTMYCMAVLPRSR